MQSPDIVPTVISPEAREVAQVIDREIGKLLEEHGLARTNNTGALERVTAKLVEHAINRVLDRTLKRSIQCRN